VLDLADSGLGLTSSLRFDSLVQVANLRGSLPVASRAVKLSVRLNRHLRLHFARRACTRSDS
jgi:hypothetical protein